MPSPRKRAVRAACGNILGAEPTATQIAYSNAWWTTVLTEHSNNYASSNPPFENGAKVIITGLNADYDGLIADGEIGTAFAIPATARLIVTNAGEILAPAQISFVTAGGDTVTITGHATTTGMADTTGASTNGTFDASTDSNSVAHNKAQALAIATCINLHDDFTATAVDTNVVTIQQNTAGASGNTTVTIAQNGSAGNMSDDDIKVQDSFKGGVDAVDASAAADLPHYWCDTVNGSTVIGTAVTNALTTATGALYDPSGPHSKYIPALESVSNGSAHMVVIKPTGWNTNDYITWELIGDTEGTNDKLSLIQVDAGNSMTQLEGIRASNGTIENVTSKHGTIAYTGRTLYAAANANGIAISWDADGTGADDSSMKNGWYLRWSHTAV